MKDDGIFHADEIKVTKVEAKDTTTLKIKVTATDEKTPEWAAIKMHTTNVKEVKYTPMDENNKPLGESKTAPVTESKKPVVIKFTSLVKADNFEVVLTKKTDSPLKVHVDSVKACAEKTGKRSCSKIVCIAVTK